MTTSIWEAHASPPPTSDRLQDAATRHWDLVVVGGGIVGLLSALAAREHGLSVCVLEARRVGEGTTSRSTVKVTAGHGIVPGQVASRHGAATALSYHRANTEGFTWLSGIIARLPADVGWQPERHIVYAESPDSRRRLQRTAELGWACGSDVVACAPPSWSRGEAWSWGESALVQPLSLARALAHLLQSQGVYVVEGARVVAVETDHERVRVMVDGHGVVAQDVLIASHSPVHDPDAHTLRMSVYQHGAIATPVPHGTAVPASFSPDVVSTRPVTLPDGRPGAVVVGAAFRTGAAPHDAWSVLEEWSASVLHAEAPVHRWIAQDLRSADLLPFVGRTRRQRRVILVTGLNAWGFTNAAAAAALMPRILDADREETIEPLRAWNWAADRAAVSHGMSDLAAAAGWVSASTVRDHVRSLADGHDLAPGDGRVVGGPFTPRAICRTADGLVHSVSARCTHMGCLVRWNDLEQSWDCPCHGSRFDPDGQVLEGPADRPLDPTPHDPTPHDSPQEAAR